MTSQQAEPATNERIVRLLEELTSQLADSRQQQEQIARDLVRLLQQQ